MSDALLSACEAVISQASHVQLDETRLARMAETAHPSLLAIPSWHEETGAFRGHADEIVTWLLTYNAINFSYWPAPGQARWYTQLDGQLVGQDDEALGVMAALGRAILNGVPLGDWKWLKQLEQDELDAILAPAAGAGVLPMMPERLAALHALGNAKGPFTSPGALFEVARGSAVRFVDLLVAAVPAWEDTQTYNGIALPFRKRAWLCAAMLFGRFQDDPGSGLPRPRADPSLRRLPTAAAAPRH